MPEPLIKTEKLNKIFNIGKSNEYPALRDISVDIYPDEYIILFGPSGCGKSTLLYCILGILPPTSGTVTVKGENIYAYDPKQMARYQTSTIGIIYQAFFLIPSLNIVSNVGLPMIFTGAHPSDRNKRAMELLKRFGVDEQADKLPSGLSGGQSQRVAVARALVSNPEILLADEPVGNLDSISTQQVMDTLEEINIKDKKTIILVTHDAKFLPYAHRVLYLKDGHVVREVANPTKKQIKAPERGKMLVTEIDKLSRLFPYDTPNNLKIKSIMNYLTQDLNFDQLERMEKLTKLVVEGRVDTEQYMRVLRISFEQGGVGVTAAVARTIAVKLEKVLKESADVFRFRREFDAEQNGRVSRQKKYVKKLRQALLDEYPGEITLQQLKFIDEAVEQRVIGDIKGPGFQKMLHLSQKKGGAGINIKAARSLTNFMEKLLAQGIIKEEGTE